MDGPPPSTATLAELTALLEPAGQTHLVAQWAELSPAQQARLAGQIRSLDLQLVRNFRSTLKNQAVRDVSQASSPAAIRLNSEDNPFTPPEARERGAAALARGEVGMLLVAGGQGTRLGFDPPKGLFPIGPVSNRTLFEVITDRLRAVARRYGRPIPLFIMTSPATTAQTHAYFAENNYLGLDPDDLYFFEQGMLPAVAAESGRVLLAGPGELALAPDGHGGMLAALGNSVGFDNIAARGIRTFFYGQIDNPLLTVCDPEFLGYHLLAGSEFTTQVVRKHDPAERVGVVAALGDHLEIVEYSDLTPEAAAARAADGTLVLWAGNTAVHAFDVAFLTRMSHTSEALPLHLARKSVPYFDPETKQTVEPTEPNAIKFERFIFDLMPSAQNALVVEVERATSFAPVKNAEGAASDTPSSARAAMAALHRAWLEEVGVKVAAEARVEIHPLYALDVDELRSKVAPGLEIRQDTYLRPEGVS
jgi:UDP-N-acetylglucosamine/UDP-N-acetylgalactosamine diphosphorylase